VSGLGGEKAAGKKKGRRRETTLPYTPNLFLLPWKGCHEHWDLFFAFRKLVDHACHIVRTIRSSESISGDEIPSLFSLPLWCLLALFITDFVSATCQLQQK